MKILISAAETSSDAHAAQLLRAIRAESAAPVDAFGIGGPRLRAEGQRQVFDARELLSMGFVEILGRLPRIISALRRIEREAESEKPDVAVFVDYPDFHFRLARRLAKQGIPLIYYIPPKVWAWRKGRVKFLKRFFDRILCILPFEEEFYRKAQVSVRYVGNPLQDELPLEGTREEARIKLGLAPDDKALAVLVGSRPTELKRHLEVFLNGAELVAQRLEERGELAPGRKLQVLLPFAATSDVAALAVRVKEWEVAHARRIQLRVSQGDSGWVMRAADAGLIKSGTSTLEAALLDLPHVIAYRPNAFTCFIVRRLIRYHGAVGLSNLVAGSRNPPYSITELTCSGVTAESIATELEFLFSPSEKLQRVNEANRAVQKAVIRGKESPSRIAAQEVLAVLAESGAKERSPA